MKKVKKHSKVNLWTNHTSTMLSITLVLFMLGLLLLVEYHSYRTTHDMQERITYKVDLMPDMGAAEAKALQKQIAAKSYVKNVDYISMDEAAKIFAEDLGEDFIGFIGYNPLYPSLMVNFKSELLPDNSKDIQHQFIEEMSAINGVSDVTFQENVVNELNDIFYKIGLFLIIFIVLLLVVCTMLISSTIRISLFAQHDTLQTMRMVGAKNSFIRRPYLMRSILFGAIGGVIANVLLAIALVVLNNQMSLQLISDEHNIWYGVIMALIIVIGIVISWIATLLALHKHLKEN